VPENTPNLFSIIRRFLQFQQRYFKLGKKFVSLFSIDFFLLIHKALPYIELST